MRICVFGAGAAAPLLGPDTLGYLIAGTRGHPAVGLGAPTPTLDILIPLAAHKAASKGLYTP